MMRAATLLWAVLAVSTSTGLFLLKYQVQAEEKHLRELRKDIVGTEQAIHVLKAEWSYLNDPLRLREQAERHLAMRPMRANQMVAIDAIPLVGGPLYEPPGMVMVKNGVAPARHHDDKPAQHAPAAKPAPAKPLPAKPLLSGRIMTAKAVKPAVKPQRGREVASAKVRP
jgi:hypothetical protein